MSTFTPTSSIPSRPTASGAGTAPAPRRRWLWWILLVAILLVLCWALFFRAARSPAGVTGRGARDVRPMPVVAELVRKTNFDVSTVSLGTVTPLHAVTVRSRVDGELHRVYLQEGQLVEAGAPLAEIDPRPFEIQKLQSEAQLARDQALLDNARVDLTRFQTLLDQDSVARQQVDTQAALVQQYAASIKVDQAQVESAALQLAYAHIVSPIAGRIGLRLVDQGNIVHASDANGLAVITQLHPITVLFSIPQDEVPKVMKRFSSGESMLVEAFDRDGRTLLAQGKLVTVDNQIDPATGTVKLRAEFSNADDALFPNQFVNVQLLVEQLQDVTVVPAAAVQRGTTGNFVYTVSPQNTVAASPVETGPSNKGQTVILKGVAPGDKVVVDGVDKLRDGSLVELISRTGSPPTSTPKRDEGVKRSKGGAKPPT